jgi:hypothetical protein
LKEILVCLGAKATRRRFADGRVEKADTSVVAEAAIKVANAVALYCGMI